MGCHTRLLDKRDTCPECVPLLHQVTTEEEQAVRAVTLQDQYMEHFDGYLELIEDHSTLLRDSSDRVSSTAIAPELLWYLCHHPKDENEPELEAEGMSESASATPSVSRDELIERLLDVDSHQACTQRDSKDFPVHRQDTDAEEASMLTEIEESLPFPDGLANPDYRVLATDEPRQPAWPYRPS